MATEDLKSPSITNADAAQVTINNSRVTGQFRFHAVDTDEMGTGDLGSTYRMLRVPSNAFDIQVWVAADDLGTTGLANIGIYKETNAGGAVVDADFFASAVDFKTAATARTDVTYEAGVYTIDDVGKPLWEALGLSADPGINYDITLTTTEAFQAAGTMTMWAEWSV